MRSKKDTRLQAIYFLEEVHRRAGYYAEWLDPKRKRGYEKDPVLAAIDGILSKTARALDTVKPDWRKVEL
jgi:hypothetical protein